MTFILTTLALTNVVAVNETLVDSVLNSTLIPSTPSRDFEVMVIVTVSEDEGSALVIVYDTTPV